MKKLLLVIISLTVVTAGCNYPLSQQETVPKAVSPEPDLTPTAEQVPTLQENTEETPVLPTASTEAPTELPTDIPSQVAEPTEPQPPILATPTLSDNPMPDLQAGIPLTISEISMLNISVGWAVGGVEDGDIHILKTMDGAITFRDVSPPIEAAPDMEVTAAFLDENHAWAIYSYGFSSIPDPVIVWRTGDGGDTWQPSAPLASPGPDFFLPDDFMFADENFGWLLVHVGAGMSKDYIFLYNTKNGGVTWEIVFDPYSPYGPHTCSKTGMAFTQTGFGALTLDCMGVRDGAIINITDSSGVKWTEHMLPVPESANSLYSAGNVCRTHSPQIHEDGTVTAAVECQSYGEDGIDSAGAFQYRMPSGADSWESTSYPGGTLLYVSESTAYAFADEIYISTDGGRTWVKQKEVAWEADASFADDDRGWVVARADSEIALVFTENGGLKWEIIEPVLVP